MMTLITPNGRQQEQEMDTAIVLPSLQMFEMLLPLAPKFNFQSKKGLLWCGRFQTPGVEGV